MSASWIGFDLDGTLAEYSTWKGIEHIGEPIKWAVDYAKELLELGVEIRIMTARVQEGREAVDHVHEWCKKVFGRTFVVTDKKDMNMVALVDDRAYGPKSWHLLPFPWEFAGATQWHNSPDNPNSPHYTPCK